MNQFAQLLFSLGMVISLAYVTAVNKDITAETLGSEGQIEVTALMGSLALICDTGSNGDNIAKAYCGEKGVQEVLKVSDPTYDDLPEFEITDMMCSGSETSVAGCKWDENLRKSYPHCGVYVGAKCNA